MRTVAFENVEVTLADLLRQVAQGEEITITQNGQPKAKLTAVPESYIKNGILVHHTGHTITSEDVAAALAEE